MEWPLNPNLNDIFTSELGKTWIFDGCGWVSTCCPPVITCDPEIQGISVIYARKKSGTVEGYGVSYFTWNSNLDRYEGFAADYPIVIKWTGTQWQLITPSNGTLIASSSTSNILEAVFGDYNLDWFDNFEISQIECGLIYNQLCLSTTYDGLFDPGTSERGPFTLYPVGYDSIADIMSGSQSNTYIGLDSNGSYVGLAYDSLNSEWNMSDGYGNSWTMTTAPTQNALILGSDWDNGVGVLATFTQGICASECYPQRDGITLMYNKDGNGWTPIYLSWDLANSRYYSDASWMELLTWQAVSVEYDSGNNLIKILADTGSGLSTIASNSYIGGFSQRLFNHTWDGAGNQFDVYCGDVGCSRMCATFNGNSTTMVPIGYDSIDSLINCTNKFRGWFGFDGTNEKIQLNWNDSISNAYTLNIEAFGDQNIGITSHTSAALIASSPYSYSQGALTGTLTLTSGDC
jgi:hypothetical protein